MKAILHDRTVIRRRALLAERLTTEWTLASVPGDAGADALRTELAGADAFIGNVFSKELREAAGNLKLIHCVGAGVDGIAQASIPPGCTLCNVYEHEIPMAEHVMMTILVLATRLREIERRFRQGDWTDSGRFDGQVHGEIHGKTLGLVGYGHIGRETARRAKAFGMRVAAVGRRPRSEPELDWYSTTHDLDRLLEMSDFLAIVCPLTDQTRGLIGEGQLRRLRPSAFLINVARAEIVEQEPLYRALRERWFAGAALDVWYDYPPAAGVRQHGSQLAFHELENVLVTPHSSAWTEPLLQRRLVRIAENLDHLARGEVLDRIVYQAPVGVAAG
jgi:phosphoglycerate dehydrogenase-like enzyme